MLFYYKALYPSYYYYFYLRQGHLNLIVSWNHCSSFYLLHSTKVKEINWCQCPSLKYDSNSFFPFPSHLELGSSQAEVVISLGSVCGWWACRVTQLLHRTPEDKVGSADMVIFSLSCLSCLSHCEPSVMAMYHSTDYFGKDGKQQSQVTLFCSASRVRADGYWWWARFHFIDKIKTKFCVF